LYTIILFFTKYFLNIFIYNLFPMKKVFFGISYLFFISFNGLAQLSITKIEPPNWWVGMANDTVQLMVYGNDLQNTIVTSSKGTKVVNVFAKDNNISFVDIVLPSQLKPQQVQLQFTKNAQSKTVQYPILANDNFKPAGFSQSDMIYLIMPDRFSNANTINDNVPGMEKTKRNLEGGRHGGDLQGIVNHADYIKNIGATAVWITPFQEMNDSTYSYHGYGASDFYAADARYTTGTKNVQANNLAYVNYVKAMHSKGLKVVIDVVTNHIGGAHQWQQMNPRITDWVHDSTLSNFEIPALTDPYAAQKDRISMEKGWFVPSMPDLNQSNPRMATYLIQNHIWWVQTAHIDGIRLDTAPFSDKHFLTQWTNAIYKQYPTISIVGEVWSSYNNPSINKYWQNTTSNKDGYNSGLRSVMDMPLWENLVKGLQTDDATKVYHILGQDFLLDKPENNFILFGNHDMERFFTSLEGNVAKYKLGLILIATLRGIPQLYYGDEFGMTGKKNINDGFVRQDMPGGWANDAKNIFTKQGYEKNSVELELLDFNTKIWNWRKTATVLHTGKLRHYLPQNGVYVYERYLGKKKLIVLLNYKNQIQQIDMANYTESFETTATKKIVYAADGAIKNTSANTITLPPYGFMILEAE
jgi:neopullulanase